MMERMEHGSFRDQDGYLFWSDAKIYRRINVSYKKHYQFLMNSGLYDFLIKNYLLISHVEVDNNWQYDCFKVIKPRLIPFISYPSEWSFSQFKDAALLTLKIQKIALSFGMILKDSSAYNIQFIDGKPIFIDTLSFEIYKKDEPWVAYRQFCQHFVSPLALMKYSDIRLQCLLNTFIDGIPLDLASSLLPRKTYLKLSILFHIHLHAKSQKAYENQVLNKNKIKSSFSQNSLLGLIDSLETGIKKINWNSGGTEWADYYNGNSYSLMGFESKKNIVSSFLDGCKLLDVWDLGANDGFFSRLAKDKGARVLSFDIDPSCVENNYLQVKKRKETNILPLLLDLTNPSGGIGWDNRERKALKDRGTADVILALALIHHLSISNNIPFLKVAKYFGELCCNLIIEFVPKKDKKVKKLLANREDVFTNYTQLDFENEFKKYFIIEAKKKIEDSDRILYLMRRV